ncbi:sigma-70 family RNA polymerase sigma factor [Inquilinus limosus]|uniref:sigma-70 family RNA polymerase sigma factor n=1 Tax=Inquilinus limosus TaxID=171674 RepID=UPI003F16B5FA
MAAPRDFERLSLAHLDAAYNLAYWLLRDRDDAQDVVQDAYLRAFRAYDRLAGEDIRPWLLTIVRNVAYRRLSARKRTANVISFDSALPHRDDEDDRVLEVASEDPSAEDQLLSRADQRLVRSALAELPPIFREVIVLREFEGMTYQQIAGVTGAPIGTVMSRLARARDQLRDQLRPLLAQESRNAL